MMKKLEQETQSIAVINTDFCLGCNQPHGENAYPTYIGLGLQAEGRSYSHVCISLCLCCVKAQDYNRVKKNLKYWLMESIAVKLDD